MGLGLGWRLDMEFIFGIGRGNKISVVHKLIEEPTPGV